MSRRRIHGYADAARSLHRGTAMANALARGLHKRPAAGGAATRAVRRRRGAPAEEAGGQMVTRNMRRGKKPKRNLREAFKLLQLSSQPLYYRFQGLNKTCSATGGWRGCHQVTDATGNAYQPLKLFDVTSYGTAFPAAALYFNSNGYAQFDAGTLPTQTSTGTSQNNWVSENLPLNTAARVPCDILEWVSAKLMLYGSLTRPTKWEVSLVQFSKDLFIPPLAGQSLVLDSGTLNDITAFWQYMSKPWTFNPLDQQNPKFRRWVKFLQRRTFMIQPKETIDAAVDGANIGAGTQVPNMVQCNLFWRANRTQRYDWNPTARLGAFAQDAAFQTATEDNDVAVAPRQRVYLMVRAQAPVTSSVTNAGAAVNTLTDPSFDYCLRVKHKRSGGRS